MTELTTSLLASPVFVPKLWPKAVLTGFKGLSVVFALIIIYASLTPSGPGAKIPHFDKLMHAFAYAAFAGALRLGWPALWGGFIIIGAGTLGVGLEFSQATFTQGRTGSFADAIANVLGVCTALLVLYPFRRRG